MIESQSINIHVGKKIAYQRDKLGISLRRLGQMCDVSYQQILKYEKGKDRVRADILFKLAKALCVNVDYFFEGSNDLYSKTKISETETKLLNSFNNLSQDNKDKIIDYALSLEESSN